MPLFGRTLSAVALLFLSVHSILGQSETSGISPARAFLNKYFAANSELQKGNSDSSPFVVQNAVFEPETVHNEVITQPVVAESTSQTQPFSTVVFNSPTQQPQASISCQPSLSCYQTSTSNVSPVQYAPVEGPSFSIPANVGSPTVQFFSGEYYPQIYSVPCTTVQSTPNIQASILPQSSAPGNIYVSTSQTIQDLPKVPILPSYSPSAISTQGLTVSSTSKPIDIKCNTFVVKPIKPEPKQTLTQTSEILSNYVATPAAGNNQDIIVSTSANTIQGLQSNTFVSNLNKQEANQMPNVMPSMTNNLVQTTLGNEAYVIPNNMITNVGANLVQNIQVPMMPSIPNVVSTIWENQGYTVPANVAPQITECNYSFVSTPKTQETSPVYQAIQVPIMPTVSSIAPVTQNQEYLVSSSVTPQTSCNTYISVPYPQEAIQSPVNIQVPILPASNIATQAIQIDPYVITPSNTYISTPYIQECQTPVTIQVPMMPSIPGSETVTQSNQYVVTPNVTPLINQGNTFVTPYIQETSPALVTLQIPSVMSQNTQTAYVTPCIQETTPILPVTIEIPNLPPINPFIAVAPSTAPVVSTIAPEFYQTVSNNAVSYTPYVNSPNVLPYIKDCYLEANDLPLSLNIYMEPPTMPEPVIAIISQTPPSQDPGVYLQQNPFAEMYSNPIIVIDKSKSRLKNWLPIMLLALIDRGCGNRGGGGSVGSSYSYVPYPIAFPVNNPIICGRRSSSRDSEGISEDIEIEDDEDDEQVEND